MKNRDKILITILSVFGLVLVTAFALSQPPAYKSVTINHSGHAVLEGGLVSISGNVLTVASWGGNWSVDVGSARLLNQSGRNANLSEFQSGDQLLIIGAAGDGAWSITAKIVRNRSIRTIFASLRGTISSLNATSKTFSLVTSQSGNVQINVDANTNIFVNGQHSAFSDLVNGMTASVYGVWDRNKSTVMAKSITARFPSSQNTSSSSGY